MARPIKYKKPTRIILVQMFEAVIKNLDKEAKRLGVSRTSIIQEAVDDLFLKKSRKNALTRQ